MTTRLPRLAIVGCGALVEHHSLPALRRLKWAPEVLIDPSEARRAALKRRLGKSVTSEADDWRKVADRFDAVLVAAPHVWHGPLGLALLKAGKHVFMEKPLAMTSRDGAEMVELAKANGLALNVGLLRRYLIGARWTKALLASGALGDIVSFDVSEGFIFNWAMATPSLLKKELSGGGVLMDTGAHTLDEINWWVGPLKVSRYQDNAAGGVETDCLIECELPSGGRGRIELSRARDLRNTAIIRGTAGSVEVHLYKNEVLSTSGAAASFTHEGIDASAMPKQMFGELFQAELGDFLASISEGVARGVGGEEGLASLRMIEQAYGMRTPMDMGWAAPRGDDLPADMEGKTVLVTGATGFIGGRLAEHLALERNAKVKCIVRSFAHATRLATLPVEIIPADLADKTAIATAAKGAAYIFNCAYDFRSRAQNMDGIRNLIGAAISEGVERLVHVSTFSVYEPFADGRLDEETADGDRSWEYARNKLDLEAEVLAATRDAGLKGTIIQPTIVYGPFSKPWTIQPAESLLDGTVVLPGAGEGLCNGIYIEDLIDAMVLAATRPGAIGERFVVSGPAPVTWARFYSEFARTLGAPGPIFRPAEDISRENHGLRKDIGMLLADPKKIIQIAVRWYPMRRFLQGALDAMPPAIHQIVIKHYFERGGPQPGQVILPDPRALALLTARPEVSNDKAERLIGYRPQYDFNDGMRLTAEYLRWAYGHRRPAPRPARPGEDVLMEGTADAV